MTTTEVGKKLVDLCRQVKHLEAIDTLYDRDVVSIEALAMPGYPARLEGIDKIRAKNQTWLETNEIHGQELKGPYPNGERFIVHMKMDVTPKSGPRRGQRATFEETALYTVKNGKIVQEEFFYDMGG